MFFLFTLIQSGWWDCSEGENSGRREWGGGGGGGEGVAILRVKIKTASIPRLVVVPQELIFFCKQNQI